MNEWILALRQNRKVVWRTTLDLFGGKTEIIICIKITNTRRLLLTGNYFALCAWFKTAMLFLTIFYIYGVRCDILPRSGHFSSVRTKSNKFRLEGLSLSASGSLWTKVRLFFIQILSWTRNFLQMSNIIRFSSLGCLKLACSGKWSISWVMIILAWPQISTLCLRFKSLNVWAKELQTDRSLFLAEWWLLSQVFSRTRHRLFLVSGIEVIFKVIANWPVISH